MARFQQPLFCLCDNVLTCFFLVQSLVCLSTVLFVVQSLVCLSTVLFVVQSLVCLSTAVAVGVVRRTSDGADCL